MAEWKRRIRSVIAFSLFYYVTTNPELSINADEYAAEVCHFTTNAADSLFYHLLFGLTYVW